MLISAAVLAATMFMFVDIPKGFILFNDTATTEIYTEAAQGTSVYQMMDYEKEIAHDVSQDSNVVALMASVGGATAQNLGGPNYGELVIHLKPRNQREKGVDEIMAELRPKLAAYPGMKG